MCFTKNCSPILLSAAATVPLCLKEIEKVIQVVGDWVNLITKVNTPPPPMIGRSDPSVKRVGSNSQTGENPSLFVILKSCLPAEMPRTKNAEKVYELGSSPSNIRDSLSTNSPTESSIQND